MKYFCLDIETTGLEPEVHQIIQVAMAYYEPEKIMMGNEPICPKIVVRVEHDSYCFKNSPAWVIENFGRIMASGNGEMIPVRLLMPRIEAFIKEHAPKNEKITLAGKNLYGLDLPFLWHLAKKERRNVEHRYMIENMVHKRVLDLGSMYAIKIPGETLPSMPEISQLTGYRCQQHDAWDDVVGVMKAIGYAYQHYWKCIG